MEKSFENNIPSLEKKENEKQFTLDMTPAQKQDLIRMISYELSEAVTPEHGNRLNDLFKKLTGKNHENWQ
jgi:hypothetical protein